ncbi:hypothetical protein [Campylobacter troglodytis]|uniref:hypothetical protein n=1 Tax=Campylobacter troglodytis TaxID=654363 RepID=UPI00115C34A5|nr:hypothetical protein [Campylobacter troglodytis]TQR61272.1 hypothetical protein DMC01_02320 [Campylobacter troglodytis]
MPIIKDFSELEESEIYSDGLKSYGALVNFFTSFCLATLQEGAKAQDFVKHSKNEFANGRSHINEIVNFFCFVLRIRNCKQKAMQRLT